MNTVTKADLVRIVANEFGYSKTESRQFVDCFFDALTSAIIEGDRIEARGFGAFTVKQANAKAGARNPKTGEKVFVPARRKVAFKPGRILRDALSRPTDEEDGHEAHGNGQSTGEGQAPHAENGNGQSHDAVPPQPAQVPSTQENMSR